MNKLWSVIIKEKNCRPKSEPLHKCEDELENELISVVCAAHAWVEEDGSGKALTETNSDTLSDLARSIP